LYLFVQFISFQSKHIACCTDRWQKDLHEYAKFLSFTWGRGLFYTFAGSLMLGQGGLLDVIVGGFVTFVGITSIIAGKSASMKLTDMRRTLGSESAVRAKFEEMDKDDSGGLESSELAMLCASLGSPLDHHELAAALTLLDSNSDGEISFDEFYSWWSGWSTDGSDSSIFNGQLRV
jgi:hypothetical protein